MLTLYLASLVGLGAVVGGVILALDPYDSGRFSLFAAKGVPEFGPRLTAASRARQSGIDAAIIGNSTIQLIDPARLSALSGRRVVSLTIPGTGPQEQLVVARYFLGHHRAGEMRGLVLGIDSTWCSANGRLELTNPFPFWLYGESDLDYLGHMMRLATARATIQKGKLMLGYAPAARADGYDDYEAGRAWDPEAAHQRLSQAGVDAMVPDQDAAPDDIAAAPLLAQFLTRLSSNVPVVLVIPPRYRNPEAMPAAHAAARQRACTEAYRKLAQARAHTTLLDFITQRDIAGSDEFWDPIHYRAAVARRMEAAIAAALRKGE